MYREIKAINSVSLASTALHYTPNGAYDVSPLLGSTETYGFDEYASLYSYYRVVEYAYEVTVVNNNSTPNSGGNLDPQMFYVLNTNVNPTTLGSRYDLYSTNPHCQSKLVAGGYGAPVTHTFTGRHKVSQILGSGTSEMADSFRALTTANPTDLIWLTLAVENPNSTTLAFTSDVKIWMNVRFYAREVDLSLSALHLRTGVKLALKEKYLADKKIRVDGKSVSLAESPPTSCAKHVCSGCAKLQVACKGAQ